MAKEITVASLLDQPLPKRQLAAVARKCLSLEGVREDYELSLVFCNDEFIRQLNKQYRDMDTPTDVLSFPQEEGEEFPRGDSVRQMGDVVISVPTAERQAAESGHSIDDEMSALIVHGVLHILGYDHEYDEQAKTMQAREAEILKELQRKSGR